MSGAGVHRAPKPKVSAMWVVLMGTLILGLVGVGSYRLASKPPPKKPAAIVTTPFDDRIIPPEPDPTLPIHTLEPTPTLIPEPTFVPPKSSPQPRQVVPSPVRAIASPTLAPSPSDLYEIEPSTAPFVTASPTCRHRRR